MSPPVESSGLVRLLLVLAVLSAALVFLAARQVGCSLLVTLRLP